MTCSLLVRRTWWRKPNADRTRSPRHSGDVVETWAANLSEVISPVFRHVIRERNRCNGTSDAMPQAGVENARVLSLGPTKRKRDDCDTRDEEGCIADEEKHKQRTLNTTTTARASTPSETGGDDNDNPQPKSYETTSRALQLCMLRINGEFDHGEKRARGLATSPQPTTNARADDHAPVQGTTQIMATSQRTASGTTIFKGKDANGFPRDGETLECAYVRRNFKKRYLEAVVYPELDKWHKVPLGSAASDSASALGGAGGGGLLSMTVPFTPDGPVVDESLLLVPFTQGKEDICFSCAEANALESVGDHDGAARIAADKFNLALDVVKNPLGPLAQCLEGKGWNCKLDNAKDSWYPYATTDQCRTGLMSYMIDNPYEGPTVAVLCDDTGVANHVIEIFGSLIFDSNRSHALPLARESFDLFVDMDHTGTKCDGTARAMRLVPTKKMKKCSLLPTTTLRWRRRRRRRRVW